MNPRDPSLPSCCDLLAGFLERSEDRPKVVWSDHRLISGSSESNSGGSPLAGSGLRVEASPRRQRNHGRNDPKAWSGSWLAAVPGGAVAFPIAVLFHELGHFVAYRAFGFPGTALRSAPSAGRVRGSFAASFWQETSRPRRRLASRGKWRSASRRDRPPPTCSSSPACSRSVGSVRGRFPWCSASGWSHPCAGWR